MITADKLIIRQNRFIRTLFFHLVFWYSSILFYNFITGDQQIFKVHINILEVENIYLVILFLSICIAIIFSVIDAIFNDRVMRFFPLRLMILLRSILYFASAFILILIAARSPLTIFETESYTDILKLLPKMDITFIRFLAYFYVVGFLNYFIRGTIKKIGRGNIRSWIVGLMDKPREEERIFMFIDMKSSTTIAERLEHKKFSHLIQDVFNDLAVVDNYHGEIYQYLGDGAIISWSIKKGLKRNNCLNAFYAFTYAVDKRSRYYNRKYDLIPRFKAGVHVGKVMVLQVGQVRKDISYNGDTMNTAARIESMCNEYRQNLLISGTLYDMVKNKSELNFKEVGNIKLKGKRKAIDIYAVKRK